ncbi:TPA: AAA family ATPase [Morganella morganii]|uniref:AAA family ATPase n=1 Tax=Providencia stuartii TaxID=588 RepID=A0AAJ1JFV4_PROST|nr:MULTISPECIES: AAA family ATPase [Morganellaceae]HCT7708152.1 AAA family ATPase [Morganella morganii]EMA3642127.1 AAA family ATPase [Providencia stuartii]MBW3103010.1 AAA family ATPase [Providencia stuartii]MCB5216632.1 AAA family ATPase [Providencia stuartii]MDE5307003.1 AAA family ATPase [Providencia stuartii]
MSKTLTEIAALLQASDKKVQLIYAFNGTGKTRLSREFKEIIAPKGGGQDDLDESEQTPLSRHKILYYNAFTEDLFYWDNDLENGREPKLRIQPNTFTDWILRERGDTDIVKNFQRYTNDKLMPLFHEEDVIIAGKKTGEKTYPEVTFSFETGSESSGNLKISKGEERNFVWSVFYTLLQEVTSILEQPDPVKRDDDKFNKLEYVFIDDPVSSLDDTHLIELAVDLANLIKRSYYFEGRGLRFVITTHSPLFYNVLYNELNNDLKNPVEGKNPTWLYKRNQSEKYRLVKNTDETFELFSSNDHPFSYHLFLLSEIREAIKNTQVRKYHFSFMRNILEKTATFLGHPRWEDLLIKTAEGSPDPFSNRILNLSSHSAHAGDEITDIEEKDKENLEALVNHLFRTYGFKKQELQ